MQSILAREIADYDHAVSSDAGLGSVSAASLLKVVIARRRIIAVGIFVGLLAALVYVILTPKEYEATAEVMIDSRGEVVSSREAEGGTAPLEIAEVESQVELIRSEKVVREAFQTLPPGFVDKLDAERPTLTALVAQTLHGLVAQVDSLVGGGPEGAGGGGEDVLRGRIDGVRDRLAVRRVGSSYVVEVGFMAQDPAVATTMANAVAASYVHDKVETKSQLWRGAGDWLQERLVKLGDQANGAARIAQDYKTEHQIVDTAEKGLANEQQLQELNAAVIEARARAVEAAAKLDQVNKQIAAGADGMDGNAPDDLAARLRLHYADLTRRKAQAEAQAGPNSDEVRQLVVDMAAVRIAIVGDLNRVAQQLKASVDAATARQSGLEASFKTLLGQSSATSKALVHSHELDRTAEAYAALYTGLLQQYTNAVNQQSFPIATAEVISNAVLPTAPSAPRRSLALILGGLAGAGLGVAAAFARESTDTSVRLPEQIERLGVPCCAVLPVIEQEPGVGTGSRRMEVGKEQAARADRFNGEALLHMPDSVFAHAVQTVKTHITVAGLMRTTKVIGITSSRSGEGKSTIAANLAHLFAAPNRRTLLIDADVYNASLTDRFDAGAAPGLRDVLTGACSLVDVVRSTPGSTLSVLPVGQSRVASHGDLLGSARMAWLLEEARKSYDCVIVDLPPVGEIVSTREVLPHIDGLLLVATWRQTKLDALRKTIRAFDFDRNKLVGVILNRAAPEALESRGLYAGYQARMRSQAAA